MLLEYLLYCQEKQCEIINLINKKYKDLKDYKHRLSKENAGLLEDSKIYKKQLELLRSSLAKSQKLILQREFRNAPPRVVLDRIASSETKEGVDVARDWLANDEDTAGTYPNTAPDVIVETILKHEKETRDFMHQMLEQQRNFFYDEMKKSVSKHSDHDRIITLPGHDTEWMENLRKMFEQVMSDLLLNIQSNQSTVLEKLISELDSTHQEYIVKAREDMSGEVSELASIKNDTTLNSKPNTDVNDDLNQTNDSSLQLQITYLEQRINDYEKISEQWEVLEKQYLNDIATFTANAKRDSNTIIDLKRTIIKHENEKQCGSAKLLFCSLQKAVFKRYSKYFSKWYHFNVKSHQLETESNYQNIIERITIEYDNEQQHLTEESYRKQKELEDRVDSESKKNIINEARINHTKLQIQKAKEEELEKRSRRAEAAVMTSVDFSSNSTTATAIECQTDTIIDKVSVTTSMSELPPNLLKGIKEKEESLKKIDEKYLTVKHEDELMTITQNKIDTNIPQKNKDDVHSSLAAEIAKRLKTFHF